MGNNGSADDENCVGRGQLQIEKYPSNISEDEWIPTDFQTTSKQNKEVLITKRIDRRIRVEPKEYYGVFDDEKKVINDDSKNDYKNPIDNIVRLKMKYSEHCHKVGSGVLIHHTLNKSYVLTAGHNVVQLNEDDDQKLDYPQAVWVEINQNTANGFKTLNIYNCGTYQVHPKYIKYLNTYGVKESETGYDIAIIEVLDPKNKLRKIAKVKIPLYKSKMNDNMKVKVIGYPGEEKLRGELYGMMGNAEIKYVNNKIQYNKLIAYDIDTTAGQSGSPVFKVTDIENKENDEKESNDNIYQSLSEIVGIHVAGKQRKRLNFATMLNDEIIKWIHECIDGDCIKYDKCDVGVLLITSSKSKYARSLNKIHKKCQTTEIMKTTKLYYDYVSAYAEIVHKKDVLFYMKQFFEEKKSSYLIFYCGESDKNGNWIINSNTSDNITLDDISICAKQKAKDSNLIVVSDCCQSGNWVNKYKFGNISGIQASTKENEPCNPGTFTAKYAECCFTYFQHNGTMGKGKGMAKRVGGFVVGGLGTLAVGTLYDGIVKQPYHKATKQSQPTRTGGDITIGDSRDHLYEVVMCNFDSWYRMDLVITGMNTLSVGTAGGLGAY